MGLLIETVERVHGFWRGWASHGSPPDTVSIVVMGNERFVCAPGRLRRRLGAALPTDLDALLETLRDDGAEALGEARLAYVDEETLQPVATDGVAELPDDDPLVTDLHATSDRGEWNEAIGTEVREHSFAIVEQSSLLALANLQIWNDELAHVGVFTAAPARGRGLAAKVSCAAVERAYTRGFVPQWRSRVGNHASARVAGKLGFVDLGKQMTVRLRTPT